MKDIRETVNDIFLVRPPDEFEKVFDIVREYAVDQLMSIANAIRAETEAEKSAVAWLHQHLVAIAQQLPQTLEDQK